MLSPQAFKKHVLFSDYAAVRQICSPLQSLGIKGFYYLRRYNDGSFIDLSTEVQWAESFFINYFNEVYKTSDVTEAHMFCPEEGASLWILNPENTIWRESECFGFGNGISIQVDKGDFTDIFCFHSDVNDRAINQFYINNLDLLKKFGQYFIEMADSIIKKGEQNKWLVPQKYLKKITTAVPEHRRDFSKFIDCFHAPAGNHCLLTRREVECVQLCAFGKSAKEIAKELSISSRTVEKYLDHAKEKFHCSSLRQLIYLYSRKQSSAE